MSCMDMCAYNINRKSTAKVHERKAKTALRMHRETKWRHIRCLTSWLASRHCTNRTVTWPDFLGGTVWPNLSCLAKPRMLAFSDSPTVLQNTVLQKYCRILQNTILQNTPSKMIAVLLHRWAIYNSILWRGVGESLATGEIDEWMA